MPDSPEGEAGSDTNRASLPPTTPLAKMRTSPEGALQGPAAGCPKTQPFMAGATIRLQF